MIQDTFGRIHNYLRISLTDNCNLRCSYCMPDEHYQFTPSASLMQADEILAIAKIFVQEGVDKIRLTGGEPLVRKDAASIIQKLAQLPVKLCITTNATRLHHFVEVLKDAGIHSLNISLDTLQRSRYFLLTKRDVFQQVFENIQLMLDHNFQVKINAVVMKGINDDELLDFVNWTIQTPIEVRFIEFMPFSGNGWKGKQVLAWHEMMETIAARFDIEGMSGEANDTTKHFKVKQAVGSFGFITTMTSPFCGDCNRMRLTADGKMKNCLFSNTETDLLSAFRKGQEITPLIHESVYQKKAALGGQFEAAIDKIDASHIHNRSMITIGG